MPFSLPLSSLSYSVAILFWHLTFWIEVLHPDFGVTCRATYVNTSVKKCMVFSSSRLDFTDMFVSVKKCSSFSLSYQFVWFAKDWLVVWECYEIITRYQIEFTVHRYGGTKASNASACTFKLLNIDGKYWSAICSRNWDRIFPFY